LEKKKTSSGGPFSALLFGYGQFINGRLGKGTVRAGPGLVQDLSDGVVFARLAALTRDMGPLNPTGSNSSSNNHSSSGSGALRPEKGPARRRENLHRLFEALRLNGLLPSGCLKSSEASRTIAAIVQGDDPNVCLDFTFNLLLNLQLHRLKRAAQLVGGSTTTSSSSNSSSNLSRACGLEPPTTSSSSSIATAAAAAAAGGSSSRSGASSLRLSSLSDLQRVLVAWCADSARPHGLKVWWWLLLVCLLVCWLGRVHW
jgi:hypothetical protein